MASLGNFGLDVGIYGRLAVPEAILRVARFADARGFDSIWLADHVAFPTSFASRYPYSATGSFPTDPADRLMEPIATLGVLAGATSRVKLGTAVLVMPYRPPVLLARMLVTLDHFSGGRIVLGAGAGWLAEEFAVLGAPDFALRGKATDEALEIFKAVCAGGAVGHQGDVYRFAPFHSSPGAVQRPHPPILIGGVADAALRRVVRLGDGWMAVTIGPERLAERLATLRRLCAEHGRAYAALTVAYKLFVSIGAPKRSQLDARMPGTGSRQQVIDDLKALLDLGVSTVIVRHYADTLDELDDQLARFADDIVPHA
jgi:probable F420-dependent oxidoreductase